ncbi:hypothetical protein K9L97_00450 [Candidatus Woesearchaeota archaeon]|nr:hypothetical protein [Candidatus Woesearchaeota archaeon]
MDLSIARSLAFSASEKKKQEKKEKKDSVNIPVEKQEKNIFSKKKNHTMKFYMRKKEPLFMTDKGAVSMSSFVDVGQYDPFDPYELIHNIEDVIFETKEKVIDVKDKILALTYNSVIQGMVVKETLLDTWRGIYDGNINKNLRSERKEFRKDLYNELTKKQHYPDLKAKILSNLAPLPTNNQSKLAYTGLLAYFLDGIPVEDVQAFKKATKINSEQEEHYNNISSLSRVLNSPSGFGQVMAWSYGLEKVLETQGMDAQGLSIGITNLYVAARTIDVLKQNYNLIKNKEYTESGTLGWTIGGLAIQILSKAEKSLKKNDSLQIKLMYIDEKLEPVTKRIMPCADTMSDYVSEGIDDIAKKLSDVTSNMQKTMFNNYNKLFSKSHDLNYIQ